MNLNEIISVCHISKSYFLRKCRRMLRPLVGDECDKIRLKSREATQY